MTNLERIAQLAGCSTEQVTKVLQALESTATDCEMGVQEFLHYDEETDDGHAVFTYINAQHPR